MNGRSGWKAQKTQKKPFLNLLMVPFISMLAFLAVMTGVKAGDFLYRIDADLIGKIDTETFRSAIRCSLPIIENVYNNGKASTSFSGEIKTLFNRIFMFDLDSPMTILNVQSPVFMSYYNKYYKPLLAGNSGDPDGSGGTGADPSSGGNGEFADAGKGTVNGSSGNAGNGQTGSGQTGSGQTGNGGMAGDSGNSTGINPEGGNTGNVPDNGAGNVTGNPSGNSSGNAVGEGSGKDGKNTSDPGNNTAKDGNTANNAANNAGNNTAKDGNTANNTANNAGNNTVKDGNTANNTTNNAGNNANNNGQNSDTTRKAGSDNSGNSGLITKGNVIDLSPISSITYEEDDEEEHEQQDSDMVAADKVTVRNLTNHKIDIAALLKEPLKWKQNKKGPEVLIYHTHASESYVLKQKDLGKKAVASFNSNPKYTVVRVGEELAKYMKRYGIETLHNGTVHDKVRNSAYSVAINTLNSYKKSYPSIQVYIDLHRDGLDASKPKLRMVKKINGKNAAQIMFVVGTNDMLPHPQWEENLKFALKVQQKLNVKYPGLARPVLLVEKRYNQQISNQAMLIEIGGDGNLLDECLESTRYVAEALNDVMKGK